MNYGKGFLVVLFLALLASLFDYGFSFLTESTYYVLTLVLIVFFLNLSVHLVNIHGTGFLFFVAFALMTLNQFDVGVVGFDRVFMFIILGVLFEFILLLTPLERNSRLFIIASTVTVGLISVIGSFLLSIDIASKFPLSFLNLVGINFGVSLSTSLIAAILWYYVRTTKSVIQFEIMLK
jgi:hypothetical protein